MNELPVSEYYDWGTPFDDEKRSLHEATVSLIKACEEHPSIDVFGVRFVNEGLGPMDAIIIEAGDGTFETDNPGGIHRREVLAITVNPLTTIPIVVRTLRRSFPGLSHQYGTPPNSPRALCLYNIVWSAVERNWTPERFLERMFWWLRESAHLRLHRTDQPLEQLFYSSRYQLILPSDYIKQAEDADKKLVIEDVPGAPGRQHTLKGKFITRDQHAGPAALALHALNLAVAGVSSSQVEAAPNTLGELHDRLVSRSSNLKDPLYSTVFEAVTNEGLPPDSPSVSKAMFVIVWVPRLGADGIERHDVLGYTIPCSLLELGRAFDMLQFDSEKTRWYRTALIGVDAPSCDDSQWRDLEVLPMQVRLAIGAEGGRQMSAIESDAADFDAVLAGVGSLGSALADTWLREGWGRWTYIDPDQLLPHNLARHVGFDYELGYAKVDVLRSRARNIYPSEPRPEAIAESVTNPSKVVLETLKGASLLVDVTTTFDAPRDLSQRDDAPRTVSLFITPSGLGSVMLLEDTARTLRSLALEAQYYRAILSNSWGEKHLDGHLGDLWVGGGCRDISLRMPFERIHLHGAILSKQLRKSVAGDSARICIWTVDDDSDAVVASEIVPYPVHSETCDGWTITYDEALVEKIQHTRLSALPNETGGVLLGVTDLKTKTIVLVDTLPPPPDSEGSPKHFIRGREGQEEALAQVHRRTARVVDYVGDWHSHPDGYPATPSGDDRKLLSSLSELMSIEGLPALMVIAGEHEITFHVQ